MRNEERPMEYCMDNLLEEYSEFKIVVCLRSASLLVLPS